MNSPKRILLVDDDRDMRAIITTILSSLDCEIIEADDVSVAVHELSNGKCFDLAIIDFWLGKGHAVSIIDLVASKSRGLPVIMISGGNNQMDLEKTEAIAVASGAVRFLQKPFRKIDLIDAVTTAMN